MLAASPMLQRILSTEEVRCLSPVQSDVPPLTFHEISERRFAEQLTRMDAVRDGKGVLMMISYGEMMRSRDCRLMR